MAHWLKLKNIGGRVYEARGKMYAGEYAQVAPVAGGKWSWMWEAYSDIGESPTYYATRAQAITALEKELSYCGDHLSRWPVTVKTPREHLIDEVKALLK
jgi:hypothetical protein